jgi:hypothetical protein
MEKHTHRFRERCMSFHQEITEDLNALTPNKPGKYFLERIKRIIFVPF